MAEALPLGRNAATPLFLAWLVALTATAGTGPAVAPVMHGIAVAILKADEA